MKITDLFDFSDFIIQNDDFINLDIDLSKQEDLLREDMFQCSSKDAKYLLDIGWYGVELEEGYFIIHVIEKFDWDNPLLSIKCSNFELLKTDFEVAYKYFIKKVSDSMLKI
jgi:hypothetical protein